ncbi:MAG TPA: hypothetical protein VFM18_17005 [Methanosarcina sp.]|nr:hypothetical protein [Methanosarcina sp.]
MSAKPPKFEKPKSFFWGEVSLGKDLQRHKEKEQELRDKIAELEANPSGEANDIYLRAYRHFLNQLLLSKAQVASKIGQKKR